MPLRKVCRRPETDHRLQLLHALNDSATAKQLKAGIEPRTASSLRVYPPPEVTERQLQKEEYVDVIPVVPATSNSNLVAGSDTKIQQPNGSEIEDAAPVKISDSLQGSGVQLLEAPGLITTVIQKDPITPLGKNTATEDAVDEAATNIRGNQLDAVLNDVDVHEADTNIEGHPNVTQETNDVLIEAATNIEEDINGTSENDAMFNEDVANTVEDMNGSPEDEAVLNEDAGNAEDQAVLNEDARNLEDGAVSNEDAGNVEGDTNGMLEDGTVLYEDGANIEGNTNGMVEDVVLLNENVTGTSTTADQ